MKRQAFILTKMLLALAVIGGCSESPEHISNPSVSESLGPKHPEAEAALDELRHTIDSLQDARDGVAKAAAIFDEQFSPTERATLLNDEARDSIRKTEARLISLNIQLKALQRCERDLRRAIDTGNTAGIQRALVTLVSLTATEDGREEK